MQPFPGLFAAISLSVLPQVSPPPSVGHSLVYVDELAMVVLVNAGLGSATDPPAATKTRLWGWNGSAWTLIDSMGPPVRNLGGVAYDARRRVLVMHGGTYSRDVSYGDTWEWSPRGGWRAFVGETPGKRDHTQMVYDPARQRIVLFGGQANEASALGDTWEFDGTRWARMTNAGAPGPIARVHHAMTYDAVLKQVVLFGGTAPGVGQLGDTWGWNGVEWRRIGVAIAPRTHARMAFHAGLQQSLLFGGLGAGVSMTVLGLTNGVWSPFTAPHAPSARYLTAAAFDAKRDVLVLFGGGNPKGTDLFADTWLLGKTWVEAN